MPKAIRLKQYFEELESPLSCCSNPVPYADGIPTLHEGFLVCEDFNTRGLEGNINLDSDPPRGDDQPQDFFWFWRNIGCSGKTGNDLGRWGLGKTVYRAASRTGCMLGLTIRKSDRKAYLMGQAVLSIHKRGNTEYVPEGFWGDTRDDGFPLPVEDSTELAAFCGDWRLRREKESGLSVVVPFVCDELRADNVAQAVAVNFIVPILQGRLVVTIESPQATYSFNQNSLRDECKKLQWKGSPKTKRKQPPPVDFIKECLQKDMVTLPESQVLGTDSVPVLSSDSFAADALTELKNSLRQEKLTGAKIRIQLQQKSGQVFVDSIGWLYVFVQRGDSKLRHNSFYVRNGMTITRISSKVEKQGVEALVLVDKNPLADFLGDSEGASHEDWNQSGMQRIEEKWNKTGSVGRINFCRRIVDKFVEYLTPQTEDPDYDLLSDFFFVQRTDSSQNEHTQGRDESRLDASVAPIVSKPKWFTIHEKKGGFRVSRNKSVAMPPNARLRVSVAYDIPNGNPLKTWSPFDFNFRQHDSPQWKGTSIAILAFTGNTVDIAINGEKFAFENTEFDKYRDLFVRIDDITRK
ncbi:MAG: hypothetical protein PHQ75_02705 [Thermoguttaceae bacterium]|nr:hypothetical protein [Thermoguttaceae bacterium]